MIKLDANECQDLNTALSREWLETNGLGGFASSTICGMNTRRYHGLLVAATEPPVGRSVLLSKLEETIVVDGNRIELCANRYPGAIHPAGHQYLVEFRLDPFPMATYELGGVRIEKSIFMAHGENTTVITYKLLGIPPSTECRLEISPLVAFRDYHSTMHAHLGLEVQTHTDAGITRFSPNNSVAALFLGHDANDVLETGHWYYNFEYAVEQERGLDFIEDLYNPITLQYDLAGIDEISIIASTRPVSPAAAPGLREQEIERRRALVGSAPKGHELLPQLALAADQFIVARGDQRTVIAGYHWFGDWGRDTMISLPGLTLVNGRADICKSILEEFSRYLSQGMLPNRFPDGGEAPEYNTVDATLWFFEAIRALAAYTRDYEFIRAKLYDVMLDIMSWHVRGTRYGIRMDSDYLLASGAEGVQLTWTDAMVNGRVITPRHGKPVEIQALWYNALRIMERFCGRFGDHAASRQFENWASRAGESFNLAFWSDGAGCLLDVVGPDGNDASMRPNQIFAVSLPHSMLSSDRARRIVDAVERELLTPYGLRSLDRSDPQYAGRYAGDAASRDSVYHQGTVWAWLIGPFITAYVKTHEPGPETGKFLSDLLSGFHGHLSQAGLGQVSEIFDGDPPYKPAGCIAQAWSVAELERAIVEDVCGIKPATDRAGIS